VEFLGPTKIVSIDLTALKRQYIVCKSA